MKANVTIRLFLIILWVLVSQEGLADIAKRENFEWDSLRTLAIQNKGRLKPLDSFASESVLFITGKSSWKGLDSTEVLFGWLLDYEKGWKQERFVRIDFKPLKKTVGFNESDKYFSPEQLQNNSKLSDLIGAAAQKSRRNERLSSLDRKVLEVGSKKILLESIISSQAWSIIPNPQGINKEWYSLAHFMSGKKVPFSSESINQTRGFFKEMLSAFTSQDDSKWNEVVPVFTRFVRENLGGAGYPSLSDLSREIHYNGLRPFQWAWILYLFALILFFVHFVIKKKKVFLFGFGLLMAGFFVHSYGFVLRCMISGRPPVTNMYESVIWVSWGCVLLSWLIWIAYKNDIILSVSTLFAIIALLIADNVPLVLDPSIQPLVPVLRSNFWLTTHVLTITLSYSAFAVSLCLGNVVLGNFLFQPQKTESTQEYSLYMYRAIQIGVVLLAIGTILGGIWADYSWGRFWGWDPKEVWALVALLLYLAVLHGRITGWLKGFGFAAGTVISFLGVLMAWYGVNFVLGVGLHAYGFGSGGMRWVALYIFVQLAFMVAAFTRYKKFQS